jgi:hypothetical protein
MVKGLSAFDLLVFETPDYLGLDSNLIGVKVNFQICNLLSLEVNLMACVPAGGTSVYSTPADR